MHVRYTAFLAGYCSAQGNISTVSFREKKQAIGADVDFAPKLRARRVTLKLKPVLGIVYDHQDPWQRTGQDKDIK